MSKRIQVLETLTGQPLLERTSRGVSLTPSGSLLYIEARKLLTQAESVFEFMTNLSHQEAPVKLSASHTIAEFVLPGMLVAFDKQHDSYLAVEMMLGNSTDARWMVHEGRAEFGIVAASGDDPFNDAALREEPFLDDEIVVVVPNGHPWSELREIPLTEFVRTPLVVRDPGANSRSVVERTLEAHGISLAPPIAEVGSTRTIFEEVAAKTVPALLSRKALPAEGVVERHVQGLRFNRQFVMVLGSSVEGLPPSTRALVEFLLDHRLVGAKAKLAAA